MQKTKIFLSVVFLIIGFTTGFLTYNLIDKDSMGRIKLPFTRKYVTTGVDSSNDGVATGLGIISGFSFLSSTLLLTSIHKTKG